METTLEEALIQAAYYQIAMEKGLTVQPIGAWGDTVRAVVPAHWREEATARAKPYVLAAAEVLKPHAD